MELVRSIDPGRVDVPVLLGQDEWHQLLAADGAVTPRLVLEVHLFTLEERPEYEEVALTYQKIEWLWTNGGIEASDDWMAPEV